MIKQMVDAMKLWVRPSAASGVVDDAALNIARQQAIETQRRIAMLKARARFETAHALVLGEAGQHDHPASDRA